MPNSILGDIRLIITDWSGVMSDDRRPVYESNARMMEGYGLKRPTFQEWLPMTRLTAADFFRQFPQVKDSPEAINATYKKVYDQVRAEGIHPKVYADAQNFMVRMGLRDRLVVVVSSHPEQNLRGEAEEYQLHGYVSKFVGSARDKTHELRKVVASHNYHPNCVAYLGDTVFDIQAAKGADVKSVGVATGYHTHERLRGENPDLVVGSLTELLAHLQ